jgi:hypothetical protein
VGQYRDITAQVLETNLSTFITRVTEKLRSYSMVRDADIAMSEIRGRALGNDGYHIEVVGLVAVDAVAVGKLKLDVGGNGVLNGETGMLRLNEVKVLNDFHGVLTKLADTLGLASGREFKLDDDGVSRIRSALAD